MRLKGGPPTQRGQLGWILVLLDHFPETVTQSGTRVLLNPQTQEQTSTRCCLAFDVIVAAAILASHAVACDTGAAMEKWEASTGVSPAIKIICPLAVQVVNRKNLLVSLIVFSLHANRTFFLQVPATINLVHTLHVLQ
jgi:hypothetical protein